MMRRTTRAIEPREMKVLNGHTYVRAYCTTRDAWRTFRLDRMSAVLRYLAGARESTGRCRGELADPSGRGGR